MANLALKVENAEWLEGEIELVVCGVPKALVKTVLMPTGHITCRGIVC